MDITPLSSSVVLRKRAIAPTTPQVHMAISDDVHKIHDWVAALKQMPDVREISGSETSDPKKIADAIIRDGF